MIDEKLAAFLAIKEKEHALMRAGKWNFASRTETTPAAKPAPPKMRSCSCCAAEKPAAEFRSANVNDICWECANAPEFDPEKTLRLLAAAVGFVFPKDVITTILEKQSERDKIFAYRESLAHLRVNPHTIENRRDAAAVVLRDIARDDGDFSQFDDAATLKKEQLGEWSRKKKSAEAALVEIIWEAAEIARPWLAKFRVAADEYIVELNKEERARSHRFRVRYEPTTVTRLKLALRTLDKLIPAEKSHIMFQSPTSFLPGFAFKA